MGFPSDIEIAQANKMEHIRDIASKLKLVEDNLEMYGKYKAKLPISIIDENKLANNNLVLVTALTPTPAGEGKTTTSIGLTEGLKITFFPMIILSWTIERMSILWEEEGGHEVVIQGGGSLLAAILAYLAMSQVLIGHLMFNFPELIMAVLAVILLFGQYSGYRLSELYRFRQMAGAGD